MSERSKGNLLNGESAIKLSPKSLKDVKHVSALRTESPKKAPTGGSPVKSKENSDDKPQKKMKQASITFYFVLFCQICPWKFHFIFV